MIDEVNYGSLITTTKCYGCIHFPLCIEQNGVVKEFNKNIWQLKYIVTKKMNIDV